MEGLLWGLGRFATCSFAVLSEFGLISLAFMEKSPFATCETLTSEDCSLLFGAVFAALVSRFLLAGSVTSTSVFLNKRSAFDLAISIRERRLVGSCLGVAAFGASSTTLVCCFFAAGLVACAADFLNNPPAFALAISNSERRVLGSSFGSSLGCALGCALGSSCC